MFIIYFCIFVCYFVCVKAELNSTTIQFNKYSKNDPQPPLPDQNNGTSNFNKDTVHKYDDTTTYYIVGGAIGVVVLIIFLIQTIIIIRLKRKGKKVAMMERLESARSQSHDDTSRYSTMPGEKKKKQKKDRAESALYESLENLRIKKDSSPPTTIEREKYTDISQRPQYPLPDESDDGNNPEGSGRKAKPSKNQVILTLKAGKSQKHTKSPSVMLTKRPMDSESDYESEEYDYPEIEYAPKTIDFVDSVPRAVIKSPQPRHFNTNPRPSVPIKPGKPGADIKTPSSHLFSTNPRPSIPVKPGKPGGLPVMNELDDILKKKRDGKSMKHGQPKTPIPPKSSTKSSHVPPAPFKPTLKNVTPSNVVSPAVKKKPLPPPPIACEPISVVQNPGPPTTLKKPPMPAPPTEETYETVNSDASDNEEWTYEPLPEYHIYNI